ncbi:hypothetical protein J6590_032122 [Homalodisca vitripennis]|nr:hypothetical protein J6590_032122 [Homalodisca vitripennis]
MRTAMLRVSRDQSRHLTCKLEENAPSGQKPVRPDILDLSSHLFAAGQAYEALKAMSHCRGYERPRMPRRSRIPSNYQTRIRVHGQRHVFLGGWKLTVPWLGDSSSDNSSSDDDLVLLYFVPQKYHWVHPINKKQRMFGEYHHLKHDLEADDDKFPNVASPTSAKNRSSRISQQTAADAMNVAPRRLCQCDLSYLTTWLAIILKIHPQMDATPQQCDMAFSRVRSLDGIRIEELDCSKLTGNTPRNSEALNEMMRFRNDS